jgi:hypothetical protein
MPLIEMKLEADWTTAAAAAGMQCNKLLHSQADACSVVLFAAWCVCCCLCWCCAAITGAHGQERLQLVSKHLQQQTAPTQMKAQKATLKPLWCGRVPFSGIHL